MKSTNWLNPFWKLIIGEWSWTNFLVCEYIVIEEPECFEPVLYVLKFWPFAREKVVKSFCPVLYVFILFIKFFRLLYVR
jgi:hypothetical protein